MVPANHGEPDGNREEITDEPTRSAVRVPRTEQGKEESMRRLPLSLVAGAVMAGITVGLAGAFNSDTLVSVGSPTSPFSQNKQYEPAVAIDADNPNIREGRVSDGRRVRRIGRDELAAQLARSP
jgi:hypothetical protein